MFLKRYPDHTFTVVTKISPFEGHSDESFSKGVEASIRESLRALSQSKLSTVLLHRASMIKSRAWDKLVELMSEGVIQHLGVSVQSPEEFLVAASTPQLTHIQFPFNILDYRWTESGIDKIVESRPDLVVYARSIFLQGLLSTERSVKWPAVENFSPSAIVSSIIDLARDFGRESAADLCFAYVRGQRWISSSVIGMETSAQVVENARLAGLRPLTTLEIKEAALRIPRVPVQILNPACWPR